MVVSNFGAINVRLHLCHLPSRSQLNGRVTLGGANFNICEPRQLVLSPPSCGDFLLVVWLLLRCSNYVLTMFGSPAAAPSGLICTFIKIARHGANFTAYFPVVNVDWFLVIWQVLWPEFFDPELPPCPVAWWRGVMIGVGRWLAICMKATEGLYWMLCWPWIAWWQVLLGDWHWRFLQVGTEVLAVCLSSDLFCADGFLLFNTNVGIRFNVKFSCSRLDAMSRPVAG